MSRSLERYNPNVPGLMYDQSPYAIWNLGGPRNQKIVESIKGAKEEVPLNEFVESMVETIANSDEQTFFAFVSGATGAGKGTVAQAIQDGLSQLPQDKQQIITRTLSTSIISKAYIAENPTDAVQGTYPPEVYENITQRALLELQKQIALDVKEREQGKKIVYLIEAGAVIDLPTDQFYEEVLRQIQEIQSQGEDLCVADIVQQLTLPKMVIEEEEEEEEQQQQQNRLLSLGAALTCLPTTFTFLLHRDQEGELHKGIAEARKNYSDVYSHIHTILHSGESISPSDVDSLRTQLITTFFTDVDVHIDLGDGKRITSEEIAQLPLDKMFKLVEFMLNTMNTPQGIEHNNKLQNEAVGKDKRVKKVEDLYRVFKKDLVRVNGTSSDTKNRIWRGKNHAVKRKEPKKNKPQDQFKPIMILNYFADSIGIHDELKNKYEEVKQYMVENGQYKEVDQNTQDNETDDLPKQLFNKFLQEYSPTIGSHLKSIQDVLEKLQDVFLSRSKPTLEILDARKTQDEDILTLIQKYLSLSKIGPKNISVIRWQDIYDQQKKSFQGADLITVVNALYIRQKETATKEGKISIGLISDRGLTATATLNDLIKRSNKSSDRQFLIGIYEGESTYSNLHQQRLSTELNSPAAVDLTSNFPHIDSSQLDKERDITPDTLSKTIVDHVLRRGLSNPHPLRTIYAKKEST